ncbi:MAG TPA: FAD-dependent oxidoreductase [Acidimicrobiales bacterium]|nr:FAD-dependent oxidoreductase [Acidimicrobiales bacterium]
MTATVDAVVVGAGPAGSAAALTLARAGKQVLLVERGPWPGSKNMYGGVVHGRILDTLVPRWWEQVPAQRWVTRRATMVLTPTQSLTVDFRSDAWGRPPYNGCTTLRPEFDAWLAGQATAAGAELVCETVVTGPVLDGAGRVVGVDVDRPGGRVEAPIVVACDGVNSFVAKAAGLYPAAPARHFTLGAKEVLALPRDEIDRRFGLRGDEGADVEILGATGDVAGGGFLYTNADTVAIGVVLSLPGLARSGRRPEELIADLKAHPAMAPLVAGGELKEYSAHLIPEGGYDTMPALTGDGILVAGDAAALCLAAGIWLEGVNFAIASGAAAGRAAAAALDAGDTSAAGLAGYRRRLETSFVLADHRRLRRAPELLLSDRVQHAYPRVACDTVERLFTVTNPLPKAGAARAAWAALRRAGVPLPDLARDAWTALRSYG